MSVPGIWRGWAPPGAPIGLPHSMAAPGEQGIGSPAPVSHSGLTAPPRSQGDTGPIFPKKESGGQVLKRPQHPTLDWLLGLGGCPPRSLPPPAPDMGTTSARSMPRPQAQDFCHPVWDAGVPGPPGGHSWQADSVCHAPPGQASCALCRLHPRQGAHRRGAQRSPWLAGTPHQHHARVCMSVLTRVPVYPCACS